jgi:hypothetical protein
MRPNGRSSGLWWHALEGHCGTLAPLLFLFSSWLPQSLPHTPALTSCLSQTETHETRSLNEPFLFLRWRSQLSCYSNGKLVNRSLCATGGYGKVSAFGWGGEGTSSHCLSIETYAALPGTGAPGGGWLQQASLPLGRQDSRALLCPPLDTERISKPEASKWLLRKAEVVTHETPMPQSMEVRAGRAS